MNAIETVSITRRFGSFTAVEDVDLAVEPGEVVGLLGANGAGKTTLMRMILGLLRPTSGRVRLFGSAPSRETRRRTGYVPQGLGLYRDLTAAENLEFVAGAFGVSPAPVPDDARGLIGDISLGMQRRIAFTAALQHRPDLLVLDEPTSGVAPLARARLWERIRDTAATGTAILVSTHAMDEARQADRLVLMHRGRVVGRGSETDIVGGATAVEVHTSRWHDAFSRLDEAGLTATLAGTRLRIPGAEASLVRRVLESGSLEAEIRETPATLEEAMVLADREEPS
jgi:ABC-2 type transport system ATP-binding protein/ribosome-dependent ATPase